MLDCQSNLLIGPLFKHFYIIQFFRCTGKHIASFFFFFTLPLLIWLSLSGFSGISPGSMLHGCIAGEEVWAVPSFKTWLILYPLCHVSHVLARFGYLFWRYLQFYKRSQYADLCSLWCLLECLSRRQLGRFVQVTGALLRPHHERGALLSSEHPRTLHGSQQTGERMGLEEKSWEFLSQEQTEPFVLFLH